MENSLNINNLSTAFGYKKNRELRFTYYIFKLLKHPAWVKTLSFFANGILKYNIPLKGLIKNSVFKVFCSGENITEAFATIKKLETYHVKSVLDYVAEGEKTQRVFRRNKMIIVKNIFKLGQEAPGNSVSVKFTSLEEIDYFIVLNGLALNNKLPDDERYLKFLKRIDIICAAAAKNKVTVYFDAEDRNMQDIFDLVVESMMEKYNKEEAIIYNTLQMYLTDRLIYLNKMIADSRLKNYHPGIKLVRGAYVEKERIRALQDGRTSPVFNTKLETDAAFNKALEICLSQHEWVYTCIASHNEQSNLLAVATIDKYAIHDFYKKVKFSQLYGMRDNLTFNLAAKGYNSSKYLPYGEVKKAIPYLIRRAEENSSIGEQLTSELFRLRNELTRRKFLGKEIRKLKPA